MQPTYYVTPAAPCSAPAKSFPDAPAALEFARRAADAHRVGWVVWRILAGRPHKVAAFSPRP